MNPPDTITKALTERLRAIRDVIQFSKRQIQYNPRDYDAIDTLAEYEILEQDYKQALRYISAEQEIDDIIKQAFEPDGNVADPKRAMCNRLRHIADACEAGGHKSRARMFRAVAKEMEDLFL